MILVTYMETLWMQNEYNYSVPKTIYIVSIINYSSHLKFISNLIFMSTLGLVYLEYKKIILAELYKVILIT